MFFFFVFFYKLHSKETEAWSETEGENLNFTYKTHSNQHCTLVLTANNKDLHIKESSLGEAAHDLPSCTLSIIILEDD